MKQIDRYIGNLFNNFTGICKSNGLDLTNLLENEKFYKKNPCIPLEIHR